MKPTLDPSAKSWIEIAVSQRGSGRGSAAGQRAGGTHRAGGQQPQQASPGIALWLLLHKHDEAHCAHTVEESVYAALATTCVMSTLTPCLSSVA